MSSTKKSNISEMLGFDIEKTFRLTAEITSVSLIFGFFISAIVNQLVFELWELNFFSFSNPSDVIMSGISFLFYLMLPILVFSPVIILISIIYDMILKYLNIINTEKTDSGNVLILYIVFLILAIYAPIIIMKLHYVIYGSLTEDSRASIHFDLANIFALFQFGYSLLVVVGISLLKRRLNADQLIAKTIASILRVVAVIAVLIGFMQLTSLRSQLGYQTNLIQLAKSSGISCTKGRALVLWIGSGYLVARCPTGQSPFAVKIDGPMKFERSDIKGVCYLNGLNPFFLCKAVLSAPQRRSDAVSPKIVYNASQNAKLNRADPFPDEPPRATDP